MVYASDLNCNKVHGTNDEQHSLFGNLLTGAAILSAGYNAAKAEYEASQEKIEIGNDGVIDLGDLINGN